MGFGDDLLNSFSKISKLWFWIVGADLEQDSQWYVNSLPNKINRVIKKWPDHFNCFFIIFAADCQGHNATVSDEWVVAVK